jgi:hypothetical protein
MHQHLLDVFRRLDLSRARLRAAVETVPAPLRRQRPAPGRWSVAEIVEHLALVESRFTAAIETRINEAVNAGLAAETAGREPLTEELELRLADRSRARTAPELVQPSGVFDVAAAWAAAETARTLLCDTVRRADGLALSAVRYHHPSFGDLTVYQWVELIAAHELRHVAQIEELRVQLDADTAASGL